MWRWTAAVLLLAVVGLPLAMPFLELLSANHSGAAHENRLFFLAGNTLALVAGTLAFALPVGTAGAVLLFRTDLPCRRLLRWAVVLTLFVPLPVLTTAWQAALGNAGLWTTSGGPWAEGMGPAIWIHALAALPWVILIVGQGLRGVEPELEEDALLAAGPWRVLTRVTLPRCRGAIVAAGAWVALLVSGEVAVTDLMKVDTFAREVYNEFSQGGGDGLARAVVLSLPLAAVLSVALYLGLARLDRLMPPLGAALAAPRAFALGSARWLWLALTLVLSGGLAGVPLATLVWKTGLVGYPPHWSSLAALERVAGILHADAGLFWKSIVTMFLAAALAASAALVLCWLAVDAPRFRRMVFAIMALAWALPGPILGLGLKETILTLVVWVPLHPLSVVLYDGPSPVPVLWAYLVRFLPCAVAALWPAVRLLPPELKESLQLDGARPSQELRHLVWPLLRRTWLAVVVVIAALALGEIGAVAMSVETPDWKMFAHVLFDRMHYGQTHDVTAICLVLILMIATGGIAVGLALGAWGFYRRKGAGWKA